jgi:hypothetical protein
MISTSMIAPMRKSRFPRYASSPFFKFIPPSSDQDIQTPATTTLDKGKNLALAVGDKDNAKRLKISGGHAATAKKVTWDMDSDDEIIVSMKANGRTEKEIADRLAREGRIRYHSKTIGTRWARLKRAIQQHQDDLMDEELTDWHDGDVSPHSYLRPIT